MSVGNTNYGDGALEKNINGSNNTAFGICSSRDTDVSWNTSVGAYANMSNVSGISNVALGTNAHLLDVSGSYNTALGTATLLNNKANSNTAVGSNAMEKNTTGKENVSVGVQSGYENTNGEKNVFLGSYAGFKNFDGSENIFLGNNSGNNPASNFSIGSKNSFLGANTGVANTNKKYNNSTAIGYGSIIDASNQIMMGTSNENVIIPGDASFNSNVNISGNLYMTGNNIIQLTSNKTTNTNNNINSLGGIIPVFSFNITLSALDSNINLANYTITGFISNATYVMHGQYFIRNTAGSERTFNNAVFYFSQSPASNTDPVIPPKGESLKKYYISINKQTISHGDYDSLTCPFSFLINSNDFLSPLGKIYLTFRMSELSSGDNSEIRVGIINTNITRIG